MFEVSIALSIGLLIGFLFGYWYGRLKERLSFNKPEQTTWILKDK